ncbi:MAG: hypothetical protein EAY70_03925 [Sphingomonadales bacterium]|nr:MAG: hypothetical protein EAY70_03925 [Sphingomonadales bacterium]
MIMESNRLLLTRSEPLVGFQPLNRNEVNDAHIIEFFNQACFFVKPIYLRRRKVGDQVGSASQEVTDPPPIDERPAE